MKRYEYLIISVVCLIGFLFTLAAIAKAETTVSLEVISSGVGYDTGYGIDGQRSFMTDLDFKTGRVVRQYVVDNKEIEGHIHPRVKWRG
jgi:hypothetical protein